jgi:hypothetical protein
MEDRVQPERSRADRADLGAPVQTGDARRVAAQQLRREVPEAADHLGPDQVELPEQVVLAGVDLLRQGVAVPRRAAFEDVRNEHVRPGQPDLLQQLVEQPPRLAHEWQAALVLAGAGGLADEHQVGVGVARAEHHGLARGGELGALLAGAGLLPDGLELVAPLRRIAHDRDFR